MLEAKPRSWFSSEYILSHCRRPLGSFKGKWFGESLVVHLMGRRNLEFRKPTMLKSRFVLIDTEDGSTLGEAAKASIFSTKWNLKLSCGEATLIPQWMFNNSFKIVSTES